MQGRRPRRDGLLRTETCLSRNISARAQRYPYRVSRRQPGPDRRPAGPAQGAFHAAGIAGQPVQDAGAAASRRASVHRLHRRTGRDHRRQHCRASQDSQLMTKTALVVSDVDGTLLTKEKLLTERAIESVRKLHEAGIGFTITSSRPTLGMRFLIEPLGITLPIGAFNGSCIVDAELKPVEQHLIPESATRRALEVLEKFGAEIWLFNSDQWLTRDPNGVYVPHEKRAIRADPTIVADFTPYLASACKIVGASADAVGLQRCEAEMQEALGAQATAIRPQRYYLDITPPGVNKGPFVQTIAHRLGISTDAVATIGDMQNDLAMFRVSGTSFAMGNASDDVKHQATHVTASNEEEGFAKAMETILNSLG